jgi:uncharacterized membrane protein
MTNVDVYVIIIAMAASYAQGCYWARKMGLLGLIPALTVGWSLGALAPHIANLISNG